MKKLNNKGLTLVEVLAVVVILFIVVTITMNILTSSSKEQLKQVEANDTLKQTSYTLKILTKDFRRMKSFDVNNKIIGIHTSSDVDAITKIQYKQEGNNIHRIGLTSTDIVKSNEVIATNVTNFLICGDPPTVGASIVCNPLTGNTYYITIISENGQIAQTAITGRGA